jgi:cytochrome c-type biogenesis protein CcmH
MLFWFLAVAVTAVACAALYYAAAGRGVNATSAADPELDHFRLQLNEIEADAEQGRLGAAEAVAARGELARELIRVQKARPSAATRKGPAMMTIAVAVLATAVLAFGTYAYLGSPDVPAAPLAARADLPPQDLTLDEAVSKVEARLKETPDDVRGWSVLGPVYMHAGRYADAADAYRKVIALDGPSADRETDLGEALMMANGGKIGDDALKLFESAAARDPAHLRSRYYIAGHLTEVGDYETAVPAWEGLVTLAKAAKSSDDWVETAEAGLASARAGLNNGAMPDQQQVAGMVDGLSSRLMADGGTLEEWTRLVRSRLVLRQTELAQQAYDAARLAFPDPAARTALDVLAADNGLVAND